jgi:hypothetical protein
MGLSGFGRTEAREGAMGLSEDVVSREGIIASMEDVALKQFLFLRNLAEPVVARFGERGVAALDAAFRHYGQWRGEGIRMSQASLVAGHDALAVLANWDSCDLVLASLAGEVTVEGSSAKATLRLPQMPGTTYFRARQGQPELLQRYWSGLLRGMPPGYDEKLALAGTDVPLGAPWSIEASYTGKPAGRTSVDQVRAAIRDIFAEPARALAMVRGTSRNAGALYMFIAREVIRVWDATGEQLVREGVRGIGRERGSVLREKHVREGKPLNLKTLMLDWDGPLVSTWVFNEGYLSEGAWHQDCRYCPYADVWGEFGKEGLDLGLLYDIELHTTMYQTYHPGTIVRWDALKTRGDHLCKFRISIPELASPNDPEYVRPENG